ncbi:hypothetical protein NDU88_006751 [Pleurodeles waltl]|uniref:Uncharacterized protein n=1 Tax=Pleurodeles waltl TaxID=8319 RepID=A0AAV7X4N5_PLEWA|nr:hypothetical protein NDU88_006751 [Pleurodeles waltl]
MWRSNHASSTCTAQADASLAVGGGAPTGYPAVPGPALNGCCHPSTRQAPASSPSLHTGAGHTPGPGVSRDPGTGPRRQPQPRPKAGPCLFRLHRRPWLSVLRDRAFPPDPSMALTSLTLHRQAPPLASRLGGGK